jgi:hypothetical protein
VGGRAFSVLVACRSRRRLCAEAAHHPRRAAITFGVARARVRLPVSQPPSLKRLCKRIPL